MWLRTTSRHCLILYILFTPGTVLIVTKISDNYLNGLRVVHFRELPKHSLNHVAVTLLVIPIFFTFISFLMAPSDINMSVRDSMSLHMDEDDVSLLMVMSMKGNFLMECWIEKGYSSSQWEEVGMFALGKKTRHMAKDMKSSLTERVTKVNERMRHVQTMV
jgi:hypothetical protein